MPNHTQNTITQTRITDIGLLLCKYSHIQNGTTTMITATRARLLSVEYICHKTGMNDLSCGVRMWAWVSFVFSQTTRLTHRQTDGQTELYSKYRALHYMQSRYLCRVATRVCLAYSYNYLYVKPIFSIILYNIFVFFCTEIVRRAKEKQIENKRSGTTAASNTLRCPRASWTEY